MLNYRIFYLDPFLKNSPGTTFIGGLSGGLIFPDLQSPPNKKLKNKINKESSKPQESTTLPLQIGLLSKKLEWSTKHFQRILRIKNILKNENDFLAPEELSSIMPMINDRFQWIIKKQEVERNLKKPFGRKSNEQVSSSGNSVYGELKKFGPGKLIYIRSK